MLLPRSPARSGGKGSPHTGLGPEKDNGVGMSRSQLVAEHLPLLRRYARALTGSQSWAMRTSEPCWKLCFRILRCSMSSMDLAPGCFGCSRRYGIPSRSTTIPT